jgi:hypothetical protein
MDVQKKRKVWEAPEIVDLDVKKTESGYAVHSSEITPTASDS